MSRISELEARVAALESEIGTGKGRPGFDPHASYDPAWDREHGHHDYVGQGGYGVSDR